MFGRLFELGIQLDLASLYPKIQYPVSRETPMISPVLAWEHSKDWLVAYYGTKPPSKSGERYISLSVSGIDNIFYAGHVIDGRNLFPATGYLVS